MTAIEFQRELRERMGRRPFVPFDVELATGKRIRIRKEWSVASRDGSATHLGGDGRLVFEDFDFNNTTAFTDAGVATAAATA
jgi:hypothetical protein